MLRVKDAVVDRLRDKTGTRPNIDSSAPQAVIDVRVHDRRATISLDFSGESLSHRGYLADSDSEDTALSTTLAAGMLAAAGWDDLAKQGAAFIDPVCGEACCLPNLPPLRVTWRLAFCANVGVSSGRRFRSIPMRGPTWLPRPTIVSRPASHAF